MIEQVMKAEEYQPDEAIFPYLATPKIDGIRFYVHADHLWSKSNKPIPNINLQNATKGIFPDGIDGELYVSPNFNASQSLVMSDMKSLVDSGLELHIFDLYSDDSYMNRIDRLNEFRKQLISSGWKPNKAKLYSKSGVDFKIKFLFPVWIQTSQQLEKFYQDTLQAGYEGIILRIPSSRYIFGKSKSILKYKPYIDREAVILGCEEMLTNTNEAYIDATGKSKRSSAMAGMVPAGILGSFHVRDMESEVEFHVGGGPGLTSILRAQLWADRHDLGGRIIKYQSMAYGALEKPRHPKFLGFRDERDL